MKLSNKKIQAFLNSQLEEAKRTAIERRAVFTSSNSEASRLSSEMDWDISFGKLIGIKQTLFSLNLIDSYEFHDLTNEIEKIIKIAHLSD